MKTLDSIPKKIYNIYRKEVRMIEKQDWQWLIAIVINVIVQIWAVQATKQKPSNRKRRKRNR